MGKKNKSDARGFVYSTDPDFKFENAPDQEENTLSPQTQNLTVKLDTKQRAGKSVSLIEGFIGKSEDLESLGKAIKSFCGTGGSVKDGMVIIQGDQRDKMLQWLLKNGYSRTKKF
jgi:translation initiation factor 1